MRVGIIGCGPSGLCAIRNCIAEGFEPVAFEQSPEIGGEWYSTLETGPNVHSKIYKGLKTNLPKELMAFSDFPYDDSDPDSFLTPDKVFEYFRAYADAFDLRRHIKLGRRVMRVRPLDDQWEIIVQNTRDGERATFVCEAVFVCTGISAPRMPQLEGQRDFGGRIVHSRDYRSAAAFAGERVLLIGSGASALDMMLDISEVAERVAWVHKIKEALGTVLALELPTNVAERAAIKRLTACGAEFADGSVDEFTVVACATGYEMSFPFLSVDAGLSVHNKCVSPLYKQCLNANRTSLAVIGLPFFALGMPMFELQIKFCLQFWSGRRALPTRDAMLRDIHADFERRNVHVDSDCRKAHYLGLGEHAAYYDNLAAAAGVEPIKPVFAKMFTHVMAHAFENFRAFRQRNYSVLSANDFSCDCE